MEVAAQMSPAPGWRKWARRLAPYVITAAVIALILRKHPAAQIAEEIQRGQAIWLPVVAVVKLIVSLILISLADYIVVRGLFGRFTFWDMCRAKASSSLMDLIGYAWGHGGYAFWIGRKGRVGAAGAGGAMLFIMAGDLAAVCIVATLAIAVSDVEVSRAISVTAPVIAGLLLFFLATGRVGLIPRERTPKIFLPWRDLDPWRSFAQLAVRTVQIVGFILSTWVAARLFGLDIPFKVMATYFPVVLLIGAIPINVAGFGAVQAAWLLFEGYATGAQILAFQFLWTLCMAAAVVLRGLPFVKRFVDEIARGRSAE